MTTIFEIKDRILSFESPVESYDGPTSIDLVSRFRNMIQFQEICAKFEKHNIPLNPSEKFLLWQKFKSVTGLYLFINEDMGQILQTLPHTLFQDESMVRAHVRIALEAFDKKITHDLVKDNSKIIKSSKTKGESRPYKTKRTKPRYRQS